MSGKRLPADFRIHGRTLVDLYADAITLEGMLEALEELGDLHMNTPEFRGVNAVIAAAREKATRLAEVLSP